MSSQLWSLRVRSSGYNVTWSVCLAYSSTMKMEVIFSSKTSVDFQRTRPRYIPEDRTVQECCDLLYIFYGR
jgi:hypothetical protein